MRVATARLQPIVRTTNQVLSAWLPNHWFDPSPPADITPVKPRTVSALPGSQYSSYHPAPPPSSLLYIPHLPNAKISSLPAPLRRLKPPDLSLLRAAAFQSLLIQHLTSSHPRRALHLFLTSLDSLPRQTRTWNLFHQLNLFFQYRHDSLAFEAVEELRERNYEIPKWVCVKLLRKSCSQLVVHQEEFMKVMRWLKDGKGLMTTSQSQKGSELEGAKVEEALDSDLVGTILEVLKRTSLDSTWAVEIFTAYKESLPSWKVGDPKLWGMIISILGQKGDLKGAHLMFARWRKFYMTVHKPDWGTPGFHPPEAPYLSLLDLYSSTSSILAALSSSTLPHRRRRPHSRLLSPSDSSGPLSILPLLASDNLLLSTRIFNSLLRLELSRRSYTSFWGLWSKMTEGGWKKNSITWKLGVKAKRWQEGLLGNRVKRKEEDSGLREIAGYEGREGPTGKELFTDFLLQAHQDSPSVSTSLLDSNRRNHLLSHPSPLIISTTSLNAFLSYFISTLSFSAAHLVLETFQVHRIEPNERTHGIVITGIVRLWEVGVVEIDGKRDGDGGRGRGRRDGLEMIGEILKGRDMRVRLWTNNEATGNEEDDEQEEEEEDADGAKALSSEMQDPTTTSPNSSTSCGKEFKFLHATRTAPNWMLTREMRDSAYLKSLLRRCTLLDEEEWKEEMRVVRREILPRGTGRMRGEGTWNE